MKRSLSRAHTGIAILIALVCAAALAAVPASAAQTHDFLGTVGTGELVNPAGLAVDSSNGDLYVADTATGVVQRFDAAGAPAEFSSLGSNALPAPGLPGGASQVAVDNSGGANAGDFYIVRGNAVRAYAPDGEPANFAGSSAYVSANAITGTPNGSFEAASTVAVGIAGEIFIADYNAGLVYAFSPEGEFLTSFYGYQEIGLSIESKGTIYTVSEGSVPNSWVPQPAPPVTSSTSFEQGYFAFFNTTAVGADPVSDLVYLGDGTEIHQFGPHEQGNPETMTFGASQLGGGTAGIAVSGAAGTAGDVYVSTGDHVAHFGPQVETPDVVTEPAGNVDSVARTATLNGTVNPLGRPVTECEFEYGPTVAYGQTVPCVETEAQIGAGNAPVAVHAEVSGLEVADYHFRLVAGNGEGSLGGADRSFPVSGPPAVQSQSAEAGSAEARLSAQLLSGNAKTTWRFEYGPTASYGQVTSVGTIPAALTPRGVATTIVGLQPGATYHYRVVVSNSVATVAGPDATFTTSAGTVGGVCPNDSLRLGYSTFLSDCRAYELVSPADKDGGEVFPDFASQAITSGDAVAYISDTPFPGTESNPLIGTYVSSRGSSGWTTAAPDAGQYNGGTLIEAPTGAYSNDLSQALEVSQQALTPGAIEGGTNIYVRNVATRQYRLISAMPTTAPFIPLTQGQRIFAGASPDFNRIIFKSENEIAGNGESGPTNLFEWDGARMRKISILPGGESPPSGVNITNTGHPVSADARRVFFQDAFSGVLYMHEAGHEDATPISVYQAGPQAGTAARGSFGAATSDGSEVYFTAVEGLAGGITPETPTLYRYDVNSGTLTELTSGFAGGAQLISVLGASDDGSFVYFAAHAALTPDAPPTIGGEADLYVWHAGSGISFVGQTDEGTGELTGPPERQVSPNGRYFGFASYSRMTPDDVMSAGCPVDPNINNPAEICAHVFLYEYDAKTLTCVSCDGPGQGQSHLGGAADRAAFSEYRPRAVLDTGAVFFNSPNPLVSRDSNGLVDVYEWKGGQVSLISSGADENASTFADASANGRDVFFKTKQPLVGVDADNRVDLYDARVNGGIAAQNPGPGSAPCEGESCRGSSPSPPGFNAESVGTKVGVGCGAQASKAHRAAVKARKLGRRAKRARGKHARALHRQARKARKRAKHLNRQNHKCERQGR